MAQRGRRCLRNRLPTYAWRGFGGAIGGAQGRILAHTLGHKGGEGVRQGGSLLVDDGRPNGGNREHHRGPNRRDTGNDG